MSSAWALRAKTVSSALATSFTICFGWFIGHAYDGGFSLIFLPITALVCSVVTVLLALLLGLVLKVPAIRKRWTPRMAKNVGLTGVAILVLGTFLGPTVTDTDEATGESTTMLHPRISVPAYFALVFAITNRPQPDAEDEPSAGSSGSLAIT